MEAGSDVATVGPPGVRFVARPHRLKRMVMDSRVPAPSGGIAFTFDDGPHPSVTPGTLARLARYHVSATFFVLGRHVDRLPEVVRRTAAAGHHIGNHTYTHPRFRWTAFERPFRELLRCQAVVSQACGQRPTAMRPPYGRVTPGLLTAAWRLGLLMYGWTLDSGDWQCRTVDDADTCAAEVLAAVQPGDTLLLHDTNPYLGRILDRVLPELDARGLLGTNRPSLARPVVTPRARLAG